MSKKKHHYGRLDGHKAIYVHRRGRCDKTRILRWIQIFYRKVTSEWTYVPFNPQLYTAHSHTDTKHRTTNLEIYYSVLAIIWVKLQLILTPVGKHMTCNQGTSKNFGEIDSDNYPSFIFTIVILSAYQVSPRDRVTVETQYDLHGPHLRHIHCIWPSL